jgi:hypothetical protein
VVAQIGLRPCGQLSHGCLLIFSQPVHGGRFGTAATERIGAGSAYFGRDFSSARILSASADVAGL